jgi:hypothetical protein
MTTTSPAVDAQAEGAFSNRSSIGGGTYVTAPETHTRNRLMYMVLIGYFAMLVLSIVVPFLAVTLLPANVDTAKVQDLMGSMSGLGQGLFGILGVVVGYYFKQGLADKDGD